MSYRIDRLPSNLWSESGRTTRTATRTQTVSPAEHLERRIAQNLADAERWRSEHGDPGAAMGAFLRDWIGLEALEATYQEYLRHENSFVFDNNNDDEEDGDEDGREPN